jgi:hypothetical protein
LEIKHADRLIHAFYHQNCYILKHDVKTSLIYIDSFRIGSSKLHAIKPDFKKKFHSYSAREPDPFLWQDRIGNTNYRETFHSFHFSCSNYNYKNKLHMYNRIQALLSTLSNISTQRILPL